MVTGVAGDCAGAGEAAQSQGLGWERAAGLGVPRQGLGTPWGAGHPWGPPHWVVPRAQPLDPAAAKDVVTL